MFEAFKDYKPEIVEYDEEVDGGGEHLIRDALLSEKEILKAKILRAKAARKGFKTNYRQPIRTENEGI